MPEGDKWGRFGGKTEPYSFVTLEAKGTVPAAFPSLLLSERKQKKAKGTVPAAFFESKIVFAQSGVGAMETR